MAALATTGGGDSVDQQSCTTSAVPSNNVDHRLARQKAAQFLKEAEKNRKLIEKLEKEQLLRVLSRKNGWTDVAGELKECEKVLKEKRNAEKANLQKHLVKIQNGVKKFQRQLIDVKPTPMLIEKLKEIMSEVEISINTLKEEQRSCFEELLKEERACRHEITAYEKKIENWSVAVQSDPKLPSAPTVKTKALDRDLPAEVRAVEAFLQKTGGLYGGWDQYDHQAFLKVWTKHSGQPTYRKEAKLYLPGKALEDIEQHEDWYHELIYLQERKREAIQRWRVSKHRERQTRMQDQRESAEAERREKEAKHHASQHRTEQEKRELTQRLEEWKEERRRKEKQEEEQQLAEEILKKKQAKEERRRQLEVKITIEEQLRLKREQEEELERRRREEEEREMGERRKEATKGIKRFNERDMHKVEAKLQEKQLKEKEEEERQKRITAKLKEKVDSQVSRDRFRITRPTKGWEERMKHIGPSGGGQVMHTFHRAVPTWRQGL